MHGSPVDDGGVPHLRRSPLPSCTLSPTDVAIANVFRMEGPSVVHVAFAPNPPRGTRTSKNMRRGRERSKSGSDRSKRGVSPDPGSVSLGSRSVFVIIEDGYVVTNLHVVDRAYNMMLVTEERNA